MGDAKTVRQDLPASRQALPVQQPPTTAAPAAVRSGLGSPAAGRIAGQAGVSGGLGNAATAALLQRTPPTGRAAGTAGPIGRGGPRLTPPVSSATSPVPPTAATGAPPVASVSKDDIERMIAEEDLTAIRRLTDADTTVATPQQRAGLVKILADLTWTARADEAIIVRLLRSGGNNAEVARTLDALGYRQKVLDSVDDPALHAEVVQLLGAATAPAQGPIGQALASQRSRDVMAITDFATATNGQRLGLLRILLDMTWSNSAEEAKMLDILASAGAKLGPLMSDLRSTGLIKALFDHIDATENKARLTKLLEPLADAEIERDLLVFNMSKLERASVGIIGGIVSAWKEFSLSKLLMGLLQPIKHPIDTLDGYLDQLLDLVKAPSLNRLLTLARDVVGFIATWLGLLALIVGGLALAFGATIILIPGAVPAGVLAASLAADAAFFGILFLVLSGLKLLLNIHQAEEATTHRELEKQERQIGEGITILTIAALMAGFARGFKTVLGKLRGSATAPEQANTDALKDTAGEADKASQQATAAGNELKQKAGPVQQAGTEQKGGAQQLPKPSAAFTQVEPTPPVAPAESAAPAPAAEPTQPIAKAPVQVPPALKALRAQVRALRKAALTDPAAEGQLRALYESQPDSVLRKFKGDPVADDVLAERRATNPELEKAKESRRQPHEATVRVTEGGRPVGQRVRIVSGGVTPEQAAALGDWEASLASHTEAKAVRDIPLKAGQTMWITGQYDPCGSCRAAMQAAANETGGTIVYWWPGGPPAGIRFVPQAPP